MTSRRYWVSFAGGRIGAGERSPFDSLVEARPNARQDSHEVGVRANARLPAPLIAVAHMDNEGSPIVVDAGLIRQTLALNELRQRERAGLSRKALAEASVIAPVTVFRIETAETEARISTLVAFAMALGLPLDPFLEGLLGTVEQLYRQQERPSG